jgi:hypothetical protein
MADVSTPAELKAALDLLNVDIEYSNDIDLDGYGSKFQFFELSSISTYALGDVIIGVTTGTQGQIWSIDSYSISVKIINGTGFIDSEDIDAGANTVMFSTAPYDGSVVTSWIPAGLTATAENNFVASIDGKGFKTSNMAVFMPARFKLGLIARFISSTGTIKNMWMEDCDVKCSSYGGWIAGSQASTTIEKCVVSNCTLTSYETLYAASGGVAGWLYSGTVRDCYAYNCTVVGSSNISDVVGLCTGGIVTNCHSVGSTLSGGSFTQPCVGYRGGTITNCYYDKTLWGSNADGDGVTGLTSEEMKEISNFIGWDFIKETTNGTEDIWEMGDDYPIIASEVTYELSLTVQDSNAEPIENAFVTVAQVEGNEISCFITNNDGNISDESALFTEKLVNPTVQWSDSISEGRYHYLTINKPGYQTWSRQIEFSENQTITAKLRALGSIQRLTNEKKKDKTVK